MNYFRPLLFAVASLCLLANAIARDLSGLSRTDKSLHPYSASDADTIVPMTFDWPVRIALIQTGALNTLFDCYGTFGRHFSPARFDLDKSFEYPPLSGVEYLYGGALWVGGIVNGDTLVSVGFDGWLATQEFTSTNQTGSHGTIEPANHATDKALQAVFSDTSMIGIGIDPYTGPHKPMNLRVGLHAFHMEHPPANNFVIYDVVITNIGNNAIEKGWAGILLDCDASHELSHPEGYLDDIAGSLKDEQIAYITDDNGDISIWTPAANGALALKFLRTSFASTVNFNWWFPSVSVEFDFGPRLKPTEADPWREFALNNLGTPTGDRDKYYMMSHKEWDYDMIRLSTISQTDSSWIPFPQVSGDPPGFDVRFLLSAGPFDLPPGESSRFLFAMSAADTVHRIPANILNLPDNPDVYLSNLDFSGIQRNMHLADSLSQIILDPLLPAMGLRPVIQAGDSATLEWDPWVFPEVEGYDLFISEFSSSEIPHPGTVPPWLTPSASADSLPLPNTYFHTLHALDPQHIYAVALANRTSGGTGQKSKSVVISTHIRETAPQFSNEFAFAHPGELMTLQWTMTAKTVVDHYNIYKFPDSASATHRYHPFYDLGWARDSLSPYDSMYVDEVWYSYYQMVPYAQVSGSVTSFVDSTFSADAVFMVTAVDPDGFESEFSIAVYANTIPTRNKHILLFTGAGRGSTALISIDSISSFYNAVLAPWTHDNYIYIDTINATSCPEPAPTKDKCIDWHDFLRYDLVIFDDIFVDRILSPRIASGVARRILLSGGKLAVFGSLGGTIPYLIGASPSTNAVTDPTISRFFGIDSIMQMGPLYPPSQMPPVIDSVHGFLLAEQASLDYPSLEIDSLWKSVSPLVYQRFPASVGAAVSTFVLDSNSTPTHIFRSAYPNSSTDEGNVVGLHSRAEGCDTWMYGFHLWNMRQSQARDLIYRMLNDAPSDSMAATIEVEPAYGYYARKVGGHAGTLYLGKHIDGRSAADINPASIMINGTVPVTSQSLVPHRAGFADTVLAASFSLDSLIRSLEPLTAVQERNITITGNYYDNSPFTVHADLQTVARYTGDIDGNFKIDVTDLTLTVGWVFGTNSQTIFTRFMDANGNCRVNVVDVVYLVNYLFKGGPSMVYCEP